MGTHKPFGSLFDIRQAVAPLDLQTARDGDWISLKNCQGVLVVLHKGVGTDNDDVVVSFEQATAVAGTAAKALAVIDQIFSQEAVNLETVTAWVKETQAAGASFTPGDPSAQSQALYVFQIEADQLDVDGGFDCVRVRLSDVGGNAQLGSCLYIPYGLRFPCSPESLPNPMAD